MRKGAEALSDAEGALQLDPSCNRAHMLIAAASSFSIPGLHIPFGSQERGETPVKDAERIDDAVGTGRTEKASDAPPDRPSSAAAVIIKPFSLSLDGSIERVELETPEGIEAFSVRATPREADPLHGALDLEAAYLLAIWFSSHPKGISLVQDKSVLELDTGMGLPSLAAYRSGASLVVSGCESREGFTAMEEIWSINTMMTINTEGPGCREGMSQELIGTRCRLDGVDWRREYLRLSGLQGLDLKEILSDCEDPLHGKARAARRELPAQLPPVHDPDTIPKMDIVCLAGGLYEPPSVSIITSSVCWALSTPEMRGGRQALETARGAFVACLPPPKGDQVQRESHSEAVAALVSAMSHDGFTHTHYTSSHIHLFERSLSPARKGAAEHALHAPDFGGAIAITAGSEDGPIAPISCRVESKFVSVEGKELGKALLGGGNSKESKKEKRERKKRIEKKADQIATKLSKNRWAVCDNFIPSSLVARVRDEMGHLDAHYEASEIWVGKSADVGAMLQVPSVRGDRVLWMCGGHTRDGRKGDRYSKQVVGSAGSAAASLEGGKSQLGKESGFVSPCDAAVKKEIKKELGKGGATSLSASQTQRYSALRELFEAIDMLVMGELSTRVPGLEGIQERTDAMLAIYPGKASRFQRHVDNTKRDGRRLTVLCYLNTEWRSGDGGSLRIHPEIGEAVDIAPVGGRIAIFYADEMPHEVLPAHAVRHAVTLWYYDKEELIEANRSASESGNAKAASDSVGLEVRTLMGGLVADERAPTQETIDQLVLSAQGLSVEALGILASITGAHDANDFLDGVSRLDVEGIEKLRAQFRRMGDAVW